MDLRKLQRVVVDALEDVKAQDILVLNTSGLSDLFDRVILASGTSNRQTRALAAHVAEKVKEAGGEVISVEGEDTGEWVLVDLGDAVVHIMQPAVRAYYGLEEIWGGKPVRVKLGASAEPAREATAAPAAGAAEAPAAKTAKRAAGKTAAKAPASSRKSAAKNPAAKKAAAKRPAKKAASRA